MRFGSVVVAGMLLAATAVACGEPTEEQAAEVCRRLQEAVDTEGAEHVSSESLTIRGQILHVLADEGIPARDRGPHIDRIMPVAKEQCREVESSRTARNIRARMNAEREAEREAAERESQRREREKEREKEAAEKADPAYRDGYTTCSAFSLQELADTFAGGDTNKFLIAEGFAAGYVPMKQRSALAGCHDALENR